MIRFKSATPPQGNYGVLIDLLPGGDWNVSPMTATTFAAWLTQFEGVKVTVDDSGELIIYALEYGGGATERHTG